MDRPMNKTLIAAVCLLAFAGVAQAQDASAPTADSATDNGGWTGSGEFGFASAHGNSRTENINAKLGLNQENEYWKNNFFLNGMRSKGEVTVEDAAGNTVDRFSTTANRYDAGASVGYKLDPRSYIVGAGRYEHDDFGANLWQGIVSLGYGYIALKDERNELSFEIGPGYKRYRPADTYVIVDSESVAVRQPTESEMVGRGLLNYKYKLTANTSFDDTLLVEAGSKNTYLQNDAGLAVSMTRKLALKVGFQVRHNTDVLPGTKNTDTLTTTNLVYSF
jgi:putative salt-induced outer membrane protein